MFYRALTLFKEIKKSFCFNISSSLAMADFDAQQAQAQAHQNQFEQDQARIVFLEQNVNYITNALQKMVNNIPAPLPQQIFHPNLNLPPFFGSPLQLPTFKMKLIHFLVGNRNTYPDFES